MDPVDTATGEAVNKTITLTFSMPLHPPTVTDANITITPSVTRTTALYAVNHKIVVGLRYPKLRINFSFKMIFELLAYNGVLGIPYKLDPIVRLPKS